jgi:7-cyano-7-deazaguanine synthase
MCKNGEPLIKSISYFANQYFCFCRSLTPFHLFPTCFFRIIFPQLVSSLFVIMKKAVVLLSGGLDSTVALFLAKSQGFEIHALSFDYGQRHNRELRAAKVIAEKAGVTAHQIVSLKLDQWGGSSLTDHSIEVEDGNINRKNIPVTYVPARNMVFLSVAASYAEAIQAQDLFIGVSQVDYSGYVDCREAFIEAMETAINKGTVMGAEQNRPIRIHAPFVQKSKAQEIKLGEKLGVPFELTWSCYRGGEKPCGTCDSCLLRAKAFAEAGVEDKALSL